MAQITLRKVAHLSIPITASDWGLFRRFATLLASTVSKVVSVAKIALNGVGRRVHRRASTRVQRFVKFI